MDKKNRLPILGNSLEDNWIEMRFMKYETSHMFWHLKKTFARKRPTKKNLTFVEHFFPPSLEKFLSVIVETLQLFQKGMNLLPAHVTREDALSVFITYCQHRGGALILQLALVIRWLFIRGLAYSRGRHKI